MIEDLDPFVRWRYICAALGGKSRRTLHDLIKRGDFPKPDRPATRLGEPDLWRLSTAKRGIEEYAHRAGPVARSPAPPVRRVKPAAKAEAA